MMMSKKILVQRNELGKVKLIKLKHIKKASDHKMRHLDPEKDEKTEDMQQRTRRAIQNLLRKLLLRNIVSEDEVF